MTTGKLGRAAHAVYEMVRRGDVTPILAQFFRRELIALQDAGLIQRDAAGRIFDSSRAASPVVSPVHVMLALAPDVIEMLDHCAISWGTTRAGAAERILAGVQRGGARCTDPPTSGERLAAKPNA